MYVKDNLDLANEWLASETEYDWSPLERALYGGGEGDGAENTTRKIYPAGEVDPVFYERRVSEDY